MLACMKVSDNINAAAAAAHISNFDNFVEASGGPVTPREYMLARWWNAAMSPSIRLMTTTGDYTQVTNNRGAFQGTTTCGNIKRAIDSCIRYNEIGDLVSDYGMSEYLNEACIALAVGGARAILGFGDACAQITDDVISCNCGCPGHQEVAEFGMGNCLFYLLSARYVVWRQLATFMASPVPAPEAYSWPTPGRRLAAVAGTTLSPGDYIHTTKWMPLWQTTAANGLDQCLASLTDILARRAIGRSLSADHHNGSALDVVPDSKSTSTSIFSQPLHDCYVALRNVLANCDQLDSLARLRALGEGWGCFLDSIFNIEVSDPVTRQWATSELPTPRGSHLATGSHRLS